MNGRNTPKGGLRDVVSVAVPPRPSTAPPFASPAPPWRRTAGGRNGRTPLPDGATWKGAGPGFVPIAELPAMEHRAVFPAQKEVTPAPPTSAGCPPGNPNTPWWTWTPGKSTGLSTAGPTRTPAPRFSSSGRDGSRSSPRTTRWRGRSDGRDCPPPHSVAGRGAGAAHADGPVKPGPESGLATAPGPGSYSLRRKRPLCADALFTHPNGIRTRERSAPSIPRLPRDGAVPFRLAAQPAGRQPFGWANRPDWSATPAPACLAKESGTAHWPTPPACPAGSGHGNGRPGAWHAFRDRGGAPAAQPAAGPTTPADESRRGGIGRRRHRQNPEEPGRTRKKHALPIGQCRTACHPVRRLGSACRASIHRRCHGRWSSRPGRQPGGGHGTGGDHGSSDAMPRRRSRRRSAPGRKPTRIRRQQPLTAPQRLFPARSPPWLPTPLSALPGRSRAEGRSGKSEPG